MDLSVQMESSNANKSPWADQIFDEKFLLENAVLASSAWSSNSSRGPDIVCNVSDENDLIQNAHLTLSERDVQKIDFLVKKTVDDLNADDIECSNASTVDSEECSPRCDDIRELEEKYNMLYSQKQADEQVLIAGAKLADDEFHVAMTQQQSLGDQWEKLKLPNDDGIDAEADLNGYKTPVNSEIDGPLVKADVKANQEETLNLSRQIASIEDQGQQMLAVGKCEKMESAPIDFTDYSDGDPDFSRLLREIVVKMGDCSLDDILSLFSGTWLLETGLFTGLVTPEQLMVLLQRFRFVSRDNLRHVHTLVRSLDDTDLYTRAVQYTRHHHHTIHFYPEMDALPKGFGLVQSQVSGQDFTRFTREDLELVRFKLTSVLFLSPGDAYIVGVEPGRSVLVSCMLPERYVLELAEMASRGVPELKRAGIDALLIHGKTYLTGYSVRPYRDDQEHVRFLSVFKQLRDKSRRLEERDREVDQLRQEVTFMQLELDTMGAELELLTQKAVRESFTRQGLRVQQRHESRRHFRTRSLPLRSTEETGNMGPDAASRPKPLLPIKFRSTKATKRGSEALLLKTLEDRMTAVDTVERHRDAFSMGLRKQFGETNKLMGEIQDILGELGTL